MAPPACGTIARRQQHVTQYSPVHPHPAHQVTYQTSYGQLLDLTTAPIGSVDLSKYTLENYMLIVTYKTAYYSFYLPVACGMVLAGIRDEEAYQVAEKILVEMGQYFQVRLFCPSGKR